MENLTKSFAEKCKNLKIRYGRADVRSGKCLSREMSGRGSIHWGTVRWGSVSQETVLQSIHITWTQLKVLKIFMQGVFCALKFIFRNPDFLQKISISAAINFQQEM